MRTLWGSLVFVLTFSTGSAAPTPASLAGTAGAESDESVQLQTQTGGTTLYFPDYVDGGGWSVQLVLGNVDATAAATGEVVVYDQDGRRVSDLFDSGSTFAIPAQGSRVLRSTGTGPIRRGWIEVRMESGSVRGLLTHRNAETGIEVGVQPIPPRDQFTLFVEESSEIGTGLVLFKPDYSKRIEFRLRDKAGNDPVGQVLSHGGFQQQAWTLPDWFQGIDTTFLGDFRGTLFLRSGDGSSFAPLGLRFGKQSGSLSAVPMIPILDETGASEKLYWTDTRTGKIQRANLDGSHVEDLIISGLSAPTALALDVVGGKLYWTDTATDRIQWANLDGSRVEDLVVGMGVPADVALDLGRDKLYWTNLGTDSDYVDGAEKIQRANLNGSSIEDLVTGLGRPLGLALETSGAGQ